MPGLARLRSQGAGLRPACRHQEGRNRTQATVPEETTRFARIPAVKCGRIRRQVSSDSWSSVARLSVKCARFCSRPFRVRDQRTEERVMGHRGNAHVWVPPVTSSPDSVKSPQTNACHPGAIHATRRRLQRIARLRPCQIDGRRASGNFNVLTLFQIEGIFEQYMNMLCRQDPKSASDHCLWRQPDLAT